MDNIYSIDRFEGEYAVLQNMQGQNFDLPRSEIPENAKEGDMLIEYGGVYSIDEKLTQERKEKIARLKNRIRRKKDGK